MSTNGTAAARTLPPPGSPGAPKYWKDEISGVLALAVAQWLSEPDRMSVRDIAVMRAYCMQWADSPAWEMNPHMSADGRMLLEKLRRLARGIESARTLAAWLEAADALGMDPL